MAEGGDSDYGEDFDSESEQLIVDLVARLEQEDPPRPYVLESIEEHATPAQASAHLPVASPPKQRQQQQQVLGRHLRAVRSPSVEVRFDEGATSAGNVAGGDGNVQAFPRAAAEPEAGGENEVPDERSPLERFRTAPKRPLSVTDIVSPAWCEIQYWYSLTKHGRKKRTPAMKQGSKVHKVLEDQVHTTVEVQVQSREDFWGLKIWNIIQGLRSLRQFGLTRELEIWGVVDGQVINGIIDELSYTCPDKELEAAHDSAKADGSKPSADQASITEYFKSQGASSLEAYVANDKPDTSSPARRVYITDVKTRGSKTLPQGSSMRPTQMQLMLYRRLLSDLSLNKVDASAIFARYALKPDDAFTDAFVAQVGNLEHNFSDIDEPDSDEAEADTSQLFHSEHDTVSELLAHNSLAKLWQLMIAEFARAMSTEHNAIGDVLRAEFRSAQTGDILGSKTFPYDAARLDAYLRDELSWWKGERKAKGVEIEEAFKCRICEFADICEWRMGKIEEAAEARKARGEAAKVKVEV